ncbi:hypothetical protein M0657_012247 [Pyricularia oryzae]|uniref:Uncharacterized protein n=1 Tax=Pyricularia grisea TaxID=148305 RepID=A0A6P8BN87_PYRGI|nr:uncharacterized protein PgNI_01110 [Pyricularia grisea]XP_030988284.1 uncharacterized protein PgNI_01105 [Pyricularia grisea]KAI7908534.1 hypothetical protein M0657_012247 [Pyricularia oryzae]TLD16461.1 hypothetical protein PgNI_01110 [Pyricularia grisea]TLD17862.1 hypothetical protein PgNI_01105 [Pyricularia grisea]
MNSSHHDMTLFASWVKYQHYVQTSNPNAPRILSPQEIALAGELANNFNFTNVFRQRLELGRSFYTTVKQNLMAILQIWDAVIDEKAVFDSSGICNSDPDIQKAFIFCADTIPSRINIGSLGPQTFIVPQLKTYPANLEPFYAHNDIFANATELQTQVMQPSNELYAEALTLSESENAKVVGFENNEKEEESDSEEEEDEEDEDEYTDDDEYDNDDDGSDDDYEEINEKVDMPQANCQSQNSPERWGDSFSELVKLDMDFANNTQKLNGGVEPIRKIPTPAASRKSVKRGFAGIEGGEDGTQSKRSRKERK